MSSIGVPELLIILVIVLLVFGSSRIPKLARSLGEARGALRDREDDEAAEDP